MNDAAKLQFESQGYVVYPQLFSPSEMATITDAFMGVMTPLADEAGHDQTTTLHGMPFIEGDPFFHRLLDEPRINDIMEGLLGGDCFLQNSDGHYFVGDTPWHVDGGMPEFATAHIAFYLDPVAEGSGCLSVIGGSHHRGYHETLSRAFAAGVYDAESPDVPGRIALESDPGDAVVFNHALYHSSWGGGADRRMFSINYGATADLAFFDSFLKGRIKEGVPGNMGLRIYSDRLVEEAGPRRLRKLQKLIDLGLCDPLLDPLERAYPLTKYTKKRFPHLREGTR